MPASPCAELRFELGVAQGLTRQVQGFQHPHAAARDLGACGADQVGGKRGRGCAGHGAMKPQAADKCNTVAFKGLLWFNGTRHQASGIRPRPRMNAPLLLQIVLACVLGGLLSVAAAALIMFGLPRKWLTFTVSFSTGLLLAMATLHLLPEALESGLTPHEVFPLLLGGILAFFLLEKYALWRHSHGSGEADLHQGAQQCDDHTHSHHHHHAGAEGGTFLILVGDGFHNFTDGLLIAAAFLADPLLGWSTTFAIIAHEVPQEAGDFAILLAAGWKRSRALFWNAASSLTAVAGGVIGYYALDNARNWIPVIITIAAASFLYIAIADLMPRLKRETRAVGWHGVLLAAGIAVVVFGSSHSH
jgi:zinc and cadmium transporter